MDQDKPLYTLTVGEFKSLLKNTIQEELTEAVHYVSTEERAEVIYINEVINLTGLKKATIYTKVSKMEMPVLSRNRPLSFLRTDIVEWMENGRPNHLEVLATKHLNNIK